MRNAKKEWIRRSMVATASCVFFLLSGCFLGGGDDNITTVGDDIIDDGGNGNAPPKPVGALGIQNFREIYASFQAMSSVPATNNALRNSYQDNLARLPQSHDPEQMSESTKNAVLSLAAEACFQASRTNPGRSDVFLNGQNPSSTELAEHLVQRFYQRPASSEEINIVVDLLENGDVPDWAACTAVLANSIETISY